jgi:hypothetical protein
MVSAVPNIPSIQSSSLASPATKKAEPDRILMDSQNTPVSAIPQLLLENIGGQELLSLSRHDLVNGQSIVYRPIKNLADLSNRYGPQNLVALQSPGNVIFNNFSIKLGDKVPDSGTGPNGEIVYIEEITNNLVINVFNMAEDEQVEVEILVSGLVQDDTIEVGE